MKYLQVLAKSTIFSGMNLADIQSILACADATIELHKKGNLIFTPGGCAGKIVLVLSGSAKITASLNANAESTVEYLLPGQSFGAAMAILGLTPNVTMRATAPCQVMFLNCEKLISPCTSGCTAHYAVVRNLLFELSTIVQAQAAKVNYLHYHSLRAKLSAFLLNMGETKENISFQIPMTKTVLSEYLGISRSAMVRELCTMRDEGLISFHLNTFVIHDIATLQSHLET